MAVIYLSRDFRARDMFKLIINEELLIENSRLEDIELNNEEISLIRNHGIQGKLNIQSSSIHSRECKPRRILFIFQDYVKHPVKLKLPRNSSRVYVQKDNKWLELPKNLKKLDRGIEFRPNEYKNIKNMHYLVDLESGGQSGGSINFPK